MVGDAHFSHTLVLYHNLSPFVKNKFAYNDIKRARTFHFGTPLLFDRIFITRAKNVKQYFADT